MFLILIIRYYRVYGFLYSYYFYAERLTFDLAIVTMIVGYGRATCIAFYWLWTGKDISELNLSLALYSPINDCVTVSSVLFMMKVVDCRVCGDPNSVLRFAFVEFTDEGVWTIYIHSVV